MPEYIIFCPIFGTAEVASILEHAETFKETLVLLGLATKIFFPSIETIVPLSDETWEGLRQLKS